MGYNAAPLEKLIEEFSKFPGIGRKGATRMAYQVLSMSDQDAAALAGAIQNAHTKLHRCRVCQNYTEAELCPICASAKRDRSVICVVETPRDVQAFERTREYHGMYHVLHGLISPMDGIGAEQLTVKELLARLEAETPGVFGNVFHSIEHVNLQTVLGYQEHTDGPILRPLCPTDMDEGSAET